MTTSKGRRKGSPSAAEPPRRMGLTRLRTWCDPPDAIDLRILKAEVPPGDADKAAATYVFYHEEYQGQPPEGLWEFLLSLAAPNELRLTRLVAHLRGPAPPKRRRGSGQAPRRYASFFAAANAWIRRLGPITSELQYLCHGRDCVRSWFALRHQFLPQARSSDLHDWLLIGQGEAALAGLRRITGHAPGDPSLVLLLLELRRNLKLFPVDWFDDDSTRLLWERGHVEEPAPDPEDVSATDLLGAQLEVDLPAIEEHLDRVRQVTDPELDRFTEESLRRDPYLRSVNEAIDRLDALGRWYRLILTRSAPPDDPTAVNLEIDPLIRPLFEHRLGEAAVRYAPVQDPEGNWIQPRPPSEFTLTVLRDGVEHLRVICRGEEHDCDHEATGPGAARFTSMLGTFDVALTAHTKTSDPRCLWVIIATACHAFTAENGYGVAWEFPAVDPGTPLTN